MARKTATVILISVLLTSCISIKAVSTVPTSQVSFVTATLAPTRINLVLTATRVPPETLTPVATSLTSLSNCTNIAILLRDVTIPDNTPVKAGETFTKTWEFQNTGTCSWKNYTMKFITGHQLNAPQSSPIADTLPKDKVQVSIQLTAPSADGVYTASFTLNDANGNIIPIGTEKSFWVKIIVGNGAAVQNPSLPIATNSGNSNCIHSGNAGYISELISLINQARTDANIPTVTVNASLSAFAQSHAEDMAFNNFLSHDSSTGSFTQRMVAYGIFSEILAIGTPQNAMDQWHRDEHWDFVLNADATQIGVGYAYNSCSDYGGYFTVDFQ